MQMAALVNWKGGENKSEIDLKRTEIRKLNRAGKCPAALLPGNFNKNCLQEIFLILAGNFFHCCGQNILIKF